MSVGNNTPSFNEKLLETRFDNKEVNGKVNYNDIRLFAGRSNKGLADKIADRLGIKVSNCKFDSFSNTEIRVIPGESVRKRKVYIVQTGAYTNNCSINDYIIETLLLMDAVHRSDAKEINLLMPCYPYARQDKKDKSRAPISAKTIADILKVCHLDRIVCVDLHAAGIQGFFDCACDNLYSIGPICEYLTENLFKNSENYQEEFVAISPDEGALKRTKKYAEKLGLKYLGMSKHRNYDKKNEIESTELMGNPNLIKDRTVIIFDDMIDTGGTMVASVNYLVENGAKDAIVVVSHGILSGPAIDRINSCDHLRYILVSDSLPQEENLKKTDKLKVFTLADMYAEVIRRLESRESISDLFG